VQSGQCTDTGITGSMALHGG